MEKFTFRNLFMLDFIASGSILVLREIVDEKQMKNRDIAIKAVMYMNIIPSFSGKDVMLEVKKLSHINKFIFHFNDKKYVVLGHHYFIREVIATKFDSKLKTLPYRDQQELINMSDEYISRLSSEIVALKEKIKELEG